jgi:hypothetical protein
VSVLLRRMVLRKLGKHNQVMEVTSRKSIRG